MTTFRFVLAWVLLGGSLVMWPVSMFTFARSEPPLVLSLSFLALTIEGFNSVNVLLAERHDKGKG